MHEDIEFKHPSEQRINRYLLDVRTSYLMINRSRSPHRQCVFGKLYIAWRFELQKRILLEKEALNFFYCLNLLQSVIVNFEIEIIHIN